MKYELLIKNQIFSRFSLNLLIKLFFDLVLFYLIFLFNNICYTFNGIILLVSFSLFSFEVNEINL